MQIAQSKSEVSALRAMVMTTEYKLLYARDAAAPTLCARTQRHHAGLSAILGGENGGGHF